MCAGFGWVAVRMWRGEGPEGYLDVKGALSSNWLIDAFVEGSGVAFMVNI